MNLRKTATGLEVRHTPGCLWIFGSFFAVIGSMLLYGMLGGFTNYDEIKTWEIAVGSILAITTFGFGIWMILSHPTTITSINGRDKIISLFEKGVFLRKKTNYKFSEVSQFEIIEETDSEGDPFFYIALKPKRGKKVKISSTGIRIESYAQEMNEEINRYLNKEKFLEK